MLERNTSPVGDGRATRWVAPGKHPPLALQDVHVWKIALLADHAQLEQWSTLLSDDELERADRFRFDRHRRRFITGRAVVRILLGRYINRPPQTLDFSYNPQGKPALKDAGSLTFNFTNSRDLALLCVSRQRPLGIDLEHLGRHADYAGIVNRFFARREVEELSSLPENRRHAAFLTGWTRKEAYIKALGTGLSMPLERFVVTIAPETAPVLVSADDRPDDPDRWVFRHLQPEPGYIATLVGEGDGWDVSRYCWQEKPVWLSPD